MQTYFSINPFRRYKFSRPGAKRKIHYNIDHLTPYFITGWIVEESTRRELCFDLRINGETVAYGHKTDILRSDLVAHFGSQSRFGFHVQQDILSQNAKSALIEIVDSKTHETLVSTRRLVEKRIGNIDLVRNGYLVGWCHDPAELSPTKIDIYVDNHLLHRALLADQERSDIFLPNTKGTLGFSASIVGAHTLSLESVFRVVHHASGEEICSRSASELLSEESLNALPGEHKKITAKTAARNLQIIRPFFDTYFYTQTYKIATSQDPIQHYLDIGWIEGKDPTPWFSTQYYLEENRDVREKNINPFLHYIQSGRQEGRLTRPETGTINFDIQPRSEAATLVRLTRCFSKAGRLFVEGYARHPRYSGLPTRIDITLKGNEPRRVLARGKHDPESAPEEAGLFFKCELDATIISDKTLLYIDLVEETPNASKTIVIDLKASNTLQPDIIYPTAESDWHVVGAIDGISPTRITGWALYPKSPNTPLTLTLSIGNDSIASVKCHILRRDLGAIYGGDLYAGFVFDIPPEISSQQQHLNYSIDPAIGRNRMRRREGQLPRTGAISLDTLRPARYDTITASRALSEEPVSAIVLNLNGAGVLRELLHSAHAHEAPDKIDWIIIDHGSGDESELVAQEAALRGQQVRFILREGNLSFSNSNNYGAKLARHDTLVFLNNDLIFNAPFRAHTLSALAAEEVGAVGALLYDHLPEGANTHVAPIQHIGVCFSRKIERKWIRPFELRPVSSQFEQIGAILDVPVVTGAFLAMRRTEFDSIGGFSEDYVYGLEDVDICLKVREALQKRVVCHTGLNIVHHRGFSRVNDTNIAVRQRNNNNNFNARWSLTLRKALRNQVVTRPAYWSGATPVVAFIVAGVGEDSSAGEYFTSYELGQQLRQLFPCQIRFLTEPEWHNLEGVDILIAMVSHFDIRKAKNVNPFMVTINWARQWFDRWAEDESIYAYDLVYASSYTAAQYLTDQTGINVDVLPIATDFDKFAAGTPQENYNADYCFTGNFVGTNREIMYQLQPEQIDALGAVYGHNWNGMPFESIWRGPVSYAQMPDIYASSKIVIDDANIATKDWGSCNSRVFDAIAGGCLLISNGSKGVKELFGEKVPTFDSAETLRETIEYWTSHQDERQRRVHELQRIIQEKHTYKHRARKVFSDLSSGNLKPRIAIKCAAILAERDSWGDYHFAKSLAAELRKLGFIVRVDCRENWSSGISVTDDVNIILRGILPYDPPPHQCNILWLISHPADIPASELDKYDHIYTASDVHRSQLETILSVPVETLLQCTDGNRFHTGQVSAEERGRSAPLFVGNSRGVFRQSVRWAAEAEQEIDLYGKGWEQFVKDPHLKGQFIPNEILARYYSKARVVLCDHWDDMRQYGYLSNRAFDVLACGSWLAVDQVAGLEETLPGGYVVFRSKEELHEILEAPGFGNEEDRRALAEWVAQNHTFRNRAEVIAARIRNLLPEEVNSKTLLRSGPIDFRVSA